MLAAALVPILATALGTVLGLGARRWLVGFEPVRSFALAAVCVTIALHLMPEAVEVAGAWALVVFAGGLVLPSAIGWIGERLSAGHGRGHGHGHGHTGLAEELTYLGVLAHQVGDGLALGAAVAEDTGVRWALFLAIGAHTIPLAAVVAITFAARGGARAAVVRAALVAVAPLVGIAVVRSTAGAVEIAPWLGAAVSGLLLHVLAHDLPSARRRTASVRTAEVAAIAAGVALPLVATGDHAHGLAHEVRHLLADLALLVAPPLLVGIVGGAVVHAVAGRRRGAWLARGGGPGAALRGALLGVPLPPCSCDAIPVAGELRDRGGGAAPVVAFVLAAPELGLASVLLTAALLGWPVAAIRLVGALAIAAVVGLAVERVTGDRGAPVVGALPRPTRPLRGAIDDRVAHDGAWIAVGLVVAAFVAAAVPTGAVGGPLDAAVIAAIALPLTMSATAATPVAFALVAAGVAPGAALAGLLVGPMVNLSVIDLARRTWGAVTAAVVVAAALAIALAIAAAVDAAGVAATPMAPLGHGLATASLIAVGALIAASLWRHGLAHFLAALRGSDHGHEHAHDHDHCAHHGAPHVS